MLRITDLSGREVYINSDLIERIYGGADTAITLLNGVTVIAKERPEELVERIAEFKRRCNDKASLEIVSRQEETQKNI
jgi:flagellar protein FlbD